MIDNINAEPDYGDEPPAACFSRVFLGRDIFACGGTPGHGGDKHSYRLPWVTIEWDGRAERAVDAAQEPQPAPASHPVSHTPAVARPPFGSVLVLAVGTDAPEESVRAAAETLAATEEGVTVVTVRGVDALRVWEPAEPQPAPELTAAMRETRLVRDQVARVAASVPRGWVSPDACDKLVAKLREIAGPQT